jgi:hypothetical protein
MISMVQPLHIGNALRLFLEPPPSAVRWKLLRKGSNTIGGHDDASAALVYEGDEKNFVDTAFLQNEVMAFYKPFHTADGVTWTAGPVASGTPAATYRDQSTDVLSVVRDRLEAGLLVEVQRGALTSQIGYVQVFNAAPSLERDLSFPLVTVHLESEDQSVRAIGEEMVGGLYDEADADSMNSDGWLASVRLNIIGWSLNADERIELRKALRRIIVGNLGVFSDLGWQQVEMSQQDVDAVSGEYPAPMYQVTSSFNCIAPVRVTGSGPDSISQIDTFIKESA